MKTFALCLFALVALGSTGCTKRHMITFEDNAKHPYVEVEILEKKDYLLWSSVEHRFDMCKDAGDKLVCKRLCGAGADVQCPKGELNSIGMASTNVR